MNLNLIELWNEMGTPVKAVVILLTLQAIASLTVLVDRAILVLRSNAASKSFAERAAKQLDAGDLSSVQSAATNVPQSHLAALVGTTIRVFLDRIQAGDDGTRAAEFARRAMERKGESLSDELNRGLSVLASTGSTAPFVGLLGTVLGIINAFQLISESGSGGIGTIGGAIGESLIVTGYGLCVAIPTVLAFNWISGRIAKLEMSLTNAGGELADRLETMDLDASARRTTRTSDAPAAALGVLPATAA